MSDSFWELYKHPLWQKKRLEIMERDGFCCYWCGDEDSTLNVHHGYYERDFKPWDYEDDTLYCLCESCHKDQTEQLLLLRKTLAKIGPRYIVYCVGIIYGLAMQLGIYDMASIDTIQLARGIFHSSLERGQTGDDVTFEWKQKGFVTASELLATDSKNECFENRSLRA